MHSERNRIDTKCSTLFLCSIVEMRRFTSDIERRRRQCNYSELTVGIFCSTRCPVNLHLTYFVCWKRRFRFIYFRRRVSCIMEFMYSFRVLARRSRTFVFVMCVVVFRYVFTAIFFTENKNHHYTPNTCINI